MIVGVDLDHTMSDAAWRDEHIAPAIDTGKWDPYHSLLVHDKPATIIINLVIALHNAGHQIYIVTARPRKWLRQTYSWLHKNGILIEQNRILMRQLGNDHFCPSPELKQKLIDETGLTFDLFIDDREDVCSALAGIGITTLQVRLVS